MARTDKNNALAKQHPGPGASDEKLRALVKALARHAAERDYKASQNKTRSDKGSSS